MKQKFQLDQPRGRMLRATCLMFHGRRGQVMLLTVLIIGGTLLSATAITGLLMSYQFFQAGNFQDSAQAVFAADTGIEWGLYQLFRSTSLHPAPVFSPDLLTSYTVTCFTPAVVVVPCNDAENRIIRSVGTTNVVSRAFELTF